MTLPVIWRRQAPLAAIGILAAGAAANGLLFGSMVRCLATLPALLSGVYSVGLHCERRRAAVGLGLAIGSAAAQGVYDVKLGVKVIPGLVVLSVGVWVAGRVARSRDELAAELQERTNTLRQRRDQTARLAVEADRARVVHTLDGLLDGRIGFLAAAAERGRKAVGVDPGATEEALATIEHEGRATLGQMREVVTSLNEEPPMVPQPALEQLEGLLQRATRADARLTVKGTPRDLQPGVELSGYRIIEHLLMTLEDSPNARVEVRVRFEADALLLDVAGPPARQADPAPSLAAARERASVHGGSLETNTRGTRRSTTVRLPLVTAYG